MQLEEEEEPWWGSQWEDGKGEFVSGSLAVSGRGTSSPCRAGILEICDPEFSTQHFFGDTL